MLTIGIDARELLGQTTGVGRYLGELLRRWTARPDAATRRFVLYAPEPLTAEFARETTAHRRIGRGRGTWWEQTSLRRAVQRDAPDVFFAPAYTAPLGLRVPLAVTIHDVSFLAHPEWFRPRERWRRRFVTARTAASAAVIFTDSEFSRGEIESRLGVPRSRLRVIPPGLSPRHGARSPDGGRERLVLFVGSIFNRRRLPQLIDVFARATTDLTGARLVIVGDNRTWPHQNLAAVASARGVSDRVELLDYVDDRQLGLLYSRAAVFVFLSEYEGFGLTPLEALAAGVPIVVLDTPVAREVYGSAATYVGGHDEAAMADVVRGFLEHPGRASIGPSTGDVLARYSWARAADDTLAGIERIARP